jgi:hypothetical protein
MDIEGGKILGYFLFSLLTLISIGCFLEGKTIERRLLKLTLSILLSVMIPVVMSGSLYSLALNVKIDGIFYIILHTVIPTLAFSVFQLLFYNIKPFE